jgi:hypothetical protein
MLESASPGAGEGGAPAAARSHKYAETAMLAARSTSRTGSEPANDTVTV